MGLYDFIVKNPGPHDYELAQVRPVKKHLLRLQQMKVVVKPHDTSPHQLPSVGTVEFALEETNQEHGTAHSCLDDRIEKSLRLTGPGLFRGPTRRLEVSSDPIRPSVLYRACFTADVNKLVVAFLPSLYHHHLFQL